MNRNLVTRLCPSILQNVTGRRPSAQITAPDREGRILTMLSERERLDTFRMSREVHKRKTWPVSWRFTVSS